MDENKPPKDPDELIKLIDANLAIRDDKEKVRLKSELSWKWYEFFLLAGLFCFGIGTAATVIKGLPQENELLYRFMLLWLLGMLVMVVLTFEFLIRRYRIMRNAMLHVLTRNEAMSKEIKILRKHLKENSEESDAEE